MVHILELGYVLRRRSNDTDAILGWLSFGALLHWVWIDGDLQQQRNWAFRCDQGCSMSEVHLSIA